MLPDEKLAIRRTINKSVAFGGSARHEADKLVIEDIWKKTETATKLLLDSGACKSARRSTQNRRPT
jgi:hypothetical protein